MCTSVVLVALAASSFIACFFLLRRCEAGIAFSPQSADGGADPSFTNMWGSTAFREACERLAREHPEEFGVDAVKHVPLLLMFWSDKGRVSCWVTTGTILCTVH
jgi:hypothetical protein